MYFRYRVDFDEDPGEEAIEEAGEEGTQVIFGRALTTKDVNLKSSKYYVRLSTCDSPSCLKTVVI